MSESNLQITCIIVDDEQYARDLLRHHIDQQPFMKLVGQAKNAFEAVAILKQHSVDLIFLDIQMPHKTGIELLEDYDIESKIVFTTAYQDFALKGYEMNALDYLLKPILAERFLKCAEKIKSAFTLEDKAYQFEKIQSDEVLSIVIKSGYDQHRLNLTDIDLIESVGEYIRYHTPAKKFLVLSSLTKMETELTDAFIRIHRSFIVPKHKIKSKVGHKLTLSNGMQVPIGKTYRSKISNMNLFD